MPLTKTSPTWHFDTWLLRSAKILAFIPGRVSTEVDARLSFDREATVAQARDIIQQYDEAGISRERVLIKIAGCDLLTISPKLLEELATSTAELPRMLSPERAKESSIARIDIDQNTFEQLHRADAMASEQLAHGIEGFGSALAGLEKLLAKRLSEIGENRHPALRSIRLQ